MLRFGRGPKGDEPKAERAAVFAGAAFVYGPLGLVVVAITLVGLASVGLDLCYSFETPVERYETRADAERDGAFRRGWFPAEIPVSAFDIVEVHNLDTNSQAARFRLQQLDLEDFKTKLRPVGEARLSAVAVDIPRRHVDWWPAALVPPLKAASLQAASLAVYELASESGDVCFALDEAALQAHMWRCE